MATTAKKNQQFIREVPSNVGTLGIIVTERKKCPAGLKKPYEYVAKKAAIDKLFKNINGEIEKQENEHPSSDSRYNSSAKFQVLMIRKKPVTMGIRFTLFLLGYTVGATGDTTGCSKKDWYALTKMVQKELKSALGKDAKMYVEPFSKANKFQARFETYIAYKELM